MLGEYIPIGSCDHECWTCKEPLGDDLIFVAYAPFGVSFFFALSRRPCWKEKHLCPIGTR